MKKIEEYGILQAEDNMISSFLKLSTEPYDDWEWDGKELNVILRNRIIERYSREDLIGCGIIDD
jgi:hypothetical protein